MNKFKPELVPDVTFYHEDAIDLLEDKLEEVRNDVTVTSVSIVIERGNRGTYTFSCSEIQDIARKLGILELIKLDCLRESESADE